jgi:hypothetical protein
MATVREFLVYLTQKSVTESLARSTRGNRYVKFTPQHIPHRSFRWVCAQARG